MTTKEVGIRLSVKDKELVERAMKAVGKEGEDAFKRIQKSAVPVTGTLRALNEATKNCRGAFTDFARGAAAAAIPALSFAAAIRGTKGALDELGDIADKSAAAGLDTEFFQGIAYNAEQAGVGIDAVSAALSAFNKNSAMAANSRGELYSTLKAVNPELLRSVQLATTQEERLRLISDAISAARTETDRVALATAAWGEAGTKLLPVFREGGEALDAQIDKLRQMGVIISSDVIARADELGDKWDAASKVIDTRMKEGLIALAPLMTDLVSLAADLAKYLGQSAESLNPLADQSRAALEAQLKTLTALKAKADEGLIVSSTQWERGGARERYEAILAELGRRDDADRTARLTAKPSSLDGAGGVGGVSNSAAKAVAAIDLMAGKVDQVKSHTQMIAEDIIGATMKWGDMLGDALGDAFRTGKLEWQDLFKNILADIAKLATKRLISDPLGGLLGTIASGLLGGSGGFAPATGYVPSFGAYGSFDVGGWTGGTRGKPAGMVHGEEFVVKAGPAAANRAMLERINSGAVAGGMPTNNTTLNFNVTIEGSNMKPHEVEAAFDRSAQKILKEAARQVPEVWRNAYKRGAF